MAVEQRTQSRKRKNTEEIMDVIETVTEEEELIQGKYTKGDVLYDVMHIVMENFTVSELSKAALVCKNWYRASREVLRTRGPERIKLPDTYECMYMLPRFNLKDYMYHKPQNTILFYGPEPKLRPKPNAELEAMNVFSHHFVGRVTILGMNTVFMDEEEILSCPKRIGFDHEDKANGISGLSFPDYKDLKVVVGTCPSYDENGERNAEMIYNKVHPKDDETGPFTFFMFGHCYHPLCSFFLTHFKKNMKPDHRYTILGCANLDAMKTVARNIPLHLQADKRMEGLIVYRLSGDCLQSDSVVLNFHKRIDEIIQKLEIFRTGVTLRKNTLAWMCGASLEDKERETEIVKLVKQTFPQIPLTVTLGRPEQWYYGIDSLTRVGHQGIEYRYGATLLLMSFN